MDKQMSKSQTRTTRAQISGRRENESDLLQLMVSEQARADEIHATLARESKSSRDPIARAKQLTLSGNAVKKMLAARAEYEYSVGERAELDTPISEAKASKDSTPVEPSSSNDATPAAPSPNPTTPLPKQEPDTDTAMTQLGFNTDDVTASQAVSDKPKKRGVLSKMLGLGDEPTVGSSTFGPITARPAVA